MPPPPPPPRPSVAPSPGRHHTSKGERWLMRAIRPPGISALIRLLMHLSWGRGWGGVHPHTFHKISTHTKIFTLYINLWEINLPWYFLPDFVFSRSEVSLPALHAHWASLSLSLWLPLSPSPWLTRGTAWKWTSLRERSLDRQGGSYHRPRGSLEERWLSAGGEEGMLHMHIPTADMLNHINASAAHYYALIAVG